MYMQYEICVNLDLLEYFIASNENNNNNKFNVNNFKENITTTFDEFYLDITGKT